MKWAYTGVWELIVYICPQLHVHDIALVAWNQQ